MNKDIEKAIEYIQFKIEMQLSATRAMIHANGRKRLGKSYLKDMGQRIANYKLIIDILEKQLNNGWIPVSERLPENKKVVLITRSTERVGLGFCNRNSNNQWRDGEGYLLTCPLAWRELPEPYKEVEKK